MKYLKAMLFSGLVFAGSCLLPGHAVQQEAKETKLNTKGENYFDKFNLEEILSVYILDNKFNNNLFVAKAEYQRNKWIAQQEILLTQNSILHS